VHPTKVATVLPYPEHIRGPETWFMLQHDNNDYNGGY